MNILPDIILFKIASYLDQVDISSYSMVSYKFSVITNPIRIKMKTFAYSKTKTYIINPMYAFLTSEGICVNKNNEDKIFIGLYDNYKNNIYNPSFKLYSNEYEEFLITHIPNYIRKYDTICILVSNQSINWVRFVYTGDKLIYMYNYNDILNKDIPVHYFVQSNVLKVTPNKISKFSIYYNEFVLTYIVNEYCELEFKKQKRLNHPLKLSEDNFNTGNSD